MPTEIISHILCPIYGSTTDDVCQALNKVVPELERIHGAIDRESINIQADGDALVLYVSTQGERHPDTPPVAPPSL